jgi:mono/diheme cytochrome c family protein
MIAPNVKRSAAMGRWMTGGALLALLTMGVGAAEQAAQKGDEGYRLFKAYCWGCHHQTAEAFGPSFQTIASQRNRGEIIAMIADPEGTSKRLGYRRNSMPAFDDLKPEEMEKLADYVLRFKKKESQ